MADKSTLLHEIARFGKLFTKQKTLPCERVLTLYKEPGVISGYRPSGKSWLYYFLSIFQLHNETVNVWTHLLAAVIYISKLLLVLTQDETLPEIGTVFIVFGICATGAVLVSASAHALHSKSPRLHYVSFQFDYAGIGLYGIGKSILFLHTSCPPEVYQSLKDISLPVCVVLGWLLMSGGCMAKLLYRRPYPIQRKFVQLGSGLFLTLFGGLPVLSRYYYCFHDNECAFVSLNHHTYYILTLSLAMFFFSSHLPEKKMPGQFDIVGQGHQIFHVLIAMTTYLQFEASYHDVINSRADKWLVTGMDTFCAWTTIPTYCIGCIVIVCVLRGRVDKRIEEDLKSS